MAPTHDPDVHELLAEAAESLAGIGCASTGARLTPEVIAGARDLADRLDGARLEAAA